MTEFETLLRVLTAAGVDSIIVGGAAATAHGAARLTQDLDIVYSRDHANIDRLVAALHPYSPYLRGVARGLPFQLDADTVRRGLNFTLTTDLGALVLLGEIVGGGGFEQLLTHTTQLDVFGASVRCLDLETLIHVKRAAGRPKDLDALAELEALRDEARKPPR